MKFINSNTHRPASHRLQLRSASVVALLSATILALGTAPRAHAGHWAVTLTGSTTGYYDNYTFTNNVFGSPQPPPGAPTITFGAPPQGGNQGEWVYNNTTVPGHGVYQMLVQATFTWTHDNAQDTSMPPSTATVLESGHTEAGIMDSGRGDELMQAQDGLTANNLLDPSYYNNYIHDVQFRESHVQCKGSYITTVAVPAGATSFTRPQRTLRVGAGGGPSPTSSPIGWMTYTAMVDTTPDIVMTVTPVTSVLGGAVTATVAVTSINGFAGPVVLNLVGQMPTGQLPLLPSGALDLNGYTIVGMPSGGVSGLGSATCGPTRAQLAARVQGTFSPASVTLTSGATATATLTLTSSSAGAPGTYPIEVQGDGTYQSGGNSVTVTRDALNTLTLN